MPARPLITAATALLSAALLSTVFSQAPASAIRTTAPVAAPAQSRTGPATPTREVTGVDGRRVEVVAVGDIVCPPGAPVTATTCRHAATARLTKQIAPKAVLALGDLQYDVGRLSAFRDAYDKSWGALRDITYPTPGNHEYRTAGAQGYFDYFAGRTPSSPGYYAFDLGRWRAYSLNANCGEIDCAAQLDWLEQDLEANPRSCSLISTHHPRYSSGEHGSNTSMRRFVRVALSHRVDLMLAGHDHHYERFAPMNNQGEVRRRGVTQFVSGAGGKSHYAADGELTGSQYVEDDTFGVLRLVLRPDSFRYGFRGIDGSSQDTGTRNCV